MITIVCWKWGDLFNADHVNNLYHALKRRLHLDYAVVCITDDARGIDHEVITIPLRYTGGKRNGRRMWIFSDEARIILGSTLLQIDLDMVITSDITPLITSNWHDFRIWKCKMSSRYKFGLNPSFMMLRAGAYHHIWDEFVRDPDHMLGLANKDGWPASDQAIISHKFTVIKSLTVAEPTCPVWTSDDGIISLRDELMHVYQAPHAHQSTPLPPNTCLVSFHGRFDPNQFTMLDWVRQHWLGETPTPTAPLKSLIDNTVNTTMPSE